jgi:uncharacterized YigZ family protein
VITAQRHFVPASEARTEIEVLRSRFLACAAAASTVAEARRYIQHLRREFPDASHHVPAYLVGHGASVVAHCSDDGEPSRTAGRPALAVLRGSGLGDVVVVVTRYFGGTKLGTGGLVRAYGDAVRSVLEVLPRAEKVPVGIIRMAIPYAFFEPVRKLIGEHHGRILDEAFGADISLTVQFPLEELAAFRTALGSASEGALRLELIETGVAAIPMGGPQSTIRKAG